MIRPSFQFYPGDWQRDTALRTCSVGARGLWIEMLCIMHQAEPYGHLVVNGKPISPEVLARMVGAKAGEVGRWLVELWNAGVFNREGDTLVSRRMVRDEAVRKARAEGGKLGGNPALKDNHKVPDKVNHHANLEPTPSSSSSSSSSEPKGVGSASAAPTPEVFITLPLREGGEFVVLKSWVSELEPLYPAVDVPQTLREMKGWCLGNPHKLKVKRGIRRFITGWLKEEQARHGG